MKMVIKPSVPTGQSCQITIIIIIINVRIIDPTLNPGVTPAVAVFAQMSDDILTYYCSSEGM